MFVLHPNARLRLAQTHIVPQAVVFTHHIARDVARKALREDCGKKVVVDLKLAQDATTSAFAELILLRRSLLRTGRDLRITGLRERAAGVYEVNRLAEVLPMN